MTTPTTLQAKLTGDVASAQASIQQLIGTVDQLGKTVNASSAVAQRAFKAEADEVKRLLDTMGASEKQHAQLEKAVQSFQGRVASETRAAASAMEQARSHYGAATKDVLDGLGEIANAGKVTSQGLRDLLQGAGDMAFAFGPTGAFVGAIAVGVSAIVTLFVTSREELEKTRAEFTQKLEEMRKAANIGGITDVGAEKQRELDALRAQLARANAPFAGGMRLGEALRVQRTAPEQIAQLESELAALRDAALNAQEQRAPRGIFGTVTVTADADSAIAKRRADAAKAARDEAKKAADEQRKLMAEIERDQMQSLGVDGAGRFNSVRLETTSIADTRAQLEELGKLRREMGGVSPEAGVFSGIAESAQAAVSPLQVLRAELAQTGAQLLDVGRIAGTSIPGAVAAGVDALVSGQGNALKAMKRAFAEPIVMHLKAKAIESFALAASYAGNPVMWPLIPAALAGGAKNLAGAALVSRLGGLSGGGGGDAGGGGGASATSFGRGAGLSGRDVSPSSADRPMRIEMVIVQQTPDGRELARSRQLLQRLEDRNQPIRVTL